MKILHISNKPVYPLVDGGCVAMSKILQSLRQLSPDVDHVFIHTPKHRFAEGAYPEGTNLPFSPEHAFIDTSIRPLPALTALLTGKNYNLRRFYDRAFEHRLTALVSGSAYDVIVLESLFLTGYIPALRTVSAAQIVVRTHNVEHELWEQQASEASFPKSSYLRSLAGTLKTEEIAGLNAADRIWAITHEDAQRFSDLGVEKPISVIPVAMEVPGLISDYSCNDFFHLGSLNWEPNRRTVKRLVKLWNAIRPRTDARLHVAGSFPEDLRDLKQQGVDFHGFVADSNLFMATHGVLAAPVVSGSGVRIKLLEAMALGVCCMTSASGAAGIDPVAEAVLLNESDRAWIVQMERISRAEDLRRAVGERAREYIRKYHSFAAVNSQIRASLEG